MLKQKTSSSAQRKHANICILEAMYVPLCAWPSAHPTRTPVNLCNSWGKLRSVWSLRSLTSARRSLCVQALQTMPSTQVCMVMLHKVATS